MSEGRDFNPAALGSELTSESFCRMTALSRSADIHRLSVYCKPVQAMAHSGPGEGPIETAEITLTPMELARRFAFILAKAAEEKKRQQQDQDVEREASQTELADTSTLNN